ncbi:hypothetical protein CMK19_01830 [Candidatus Poribacteria bacterium]|nr:hypothetical protein [Candidatus Poribacteria bacterium]
MAADGTRAASGSWEFSPDSASTSAEYFINDTTLYDLGQGGCYIFEVTLHDIDAGVVIEEENWPFSQSPTDVFDSCEGLPLFPLDTDGDGVLDSEDNCPNTSNDVEVDENGCKLKTPEEVDTSDSGNTDTNTEQPDDSGPELESLEEETEVPSLGFVAAIFSILVIAILRRN